MQIKFWLKNLKERYHFEDSRIIFGWILWKEGGKVWTGCNWLSIQLVTGCCEHGNEPSGSMRR
jgi:hypothetical protein